MNASDPVDVAEIAKSKAATHDIGMDEKKETIVEQALVNHPPPEYAEDGTIRTEPTLEEMATLRRVSDSIPWTAYTVAFVELCERFSYYGTTAVCMYPLLSRQRERHG